MDTNNDLNRNSNVEDSLQKDMIFSVYATKSDPLAMHWKIGASLETVDRKTKEMTWTFPALGNVADDGPATSPAVTYIDNDRVLLCYRSSFLMASSLIYRFGTVNRAEKNISWTEKSPEYANGNWPALAYLGKNKSGQKLVLETHQHSPDGTQTYTGIYAKLGIITNEAQGKLEFLDVGVIAERGELPSIAYIGNDLIVSIHYWAEHGYYGKLGKLNRETNDIGWKDLGNLYEHLGISPNRFSSVAGITPGDSVGVRVFIEKAIETGDASAAAIAAAEAMAAAVMEDPKNRVYITMFERFVTLAGIYEADWEKGTLECATLIPVGGEGWGFTTGIGTTIQEVIAPMAGEATGSIMDEVVMPAIESLVPGNGPIYSSVYLGDSDLSVFSQDDNDHVVLSGVGKEVLPEVVGGQLINFKYARIKTDLWVKELKSTYLRLPPEIYENESEE